MTRVPDDPAAGAGAATPAAGRPGASSTGDSAAETGEPGKGATSPRPAGRKHPMPPKPPSPTGPTNVADVLAKLHGEAPSDDDTAVLKQAAEVVDGAAGTVQLEQLVAERTDDLQRLQAEYANYRKRVERDRDQARQQGVEQVVRELMPILDAIAQASEHEELTGGFKVVAGEFTRVTEKLGLTSFGAVGDEFDPTLHEALMQVPSPDVEAGRIAQVIQAGYRIGEDVIRPARVAVAAAPE